MVVLATGSGNTENPAYPGGRVAMFLCGDAAGARAAVSGLAEEPGYHPLKNGPDFGFAVLRRNT